MEMDRRIANVLAQMGGTQKEVMQTLAEYGIDDNQDGRYFRAYSCPIAQYLQLRFRARPIIVTSNFSHVASGVAANPLPVYRAIKAFDRASDARKEDEWQGIKSTSPYPSLLDYV